MKTSTAGIDLIKRFEGLELVAYLDAANVPTIGYGHTQTVKRSDVGVRITTETDAVNLLHTDLASVERQLDSWARNHGVVLSQNETDALVSFIFNVGFFAFAEKSTVAKRLIKGDREGAAEALTWWNKATVDGKKVPLRGLTRRRAAERALMLQPTDETTNNPDRPEFVTADNTRAAASETPAALQIVKRFNPLCRSRR